MSDLLLSHIDPDLIYPPFLARLRVMLDELQHRTPAVEFWAISGFRTAGEQMALWTQGRTRPGGIVTNARAFQSAHNYGLAVDFVRDALVERADLQPDWKPESYPPLGSAARARGLVWGGDWKFVDRPHVQVPKLVTAVDLAPLEAVWKAAPGADVDRLKAVWQYVDTLGLFPT